MIPGQISVWEGFQVKRCTQRSCNSGTAFVVSFSDYPKYNIFEILSSVDLEKKQHAVSGSNITYKVHLSCTQLDLTKLSDFHFCWPQVTCGLHRKQEESCTENTKLVTLVLQGFSPATAQNDISAKSTYIWVPSSFTSCWMTSSMHPSGSNSGLGVAPDPERANLWELVCRSVLTKMSFTIWLLSLWTLT